MEAKDTVMNSEQAEISFKAGETVGYNSGFIVGREHGRLVGIKEVVEWVNYYMELPELKDSYLIRLWLPQWQGKLKEWGVK